MFGRQMQRIARQAVSALKESAKLSGGSKVCAAPLRQASQGAARIPASPAMQAFQQHCSQVVLACLI